MKTTDSLAPKTMFYTKLSNFHSLIYPKQCEWYLCYCLRKEKYGKILFYRFNLNLIMNTFWLSWTFFIIFFFFLFNKTFGHSWKRLQFNYSCFQPNRYQSFHERKVKVFNHFFYFLKFIFPDIFFSWVRYSGVHHFIIRCITSAKLHSHFLCVFSS